MNLVLVHFVERIKLKKYIVDQQLVLHIQLDSGCVSVVLFVKMSLTNQ